MTESMFEFKIFGSNTMLNLNLNLILFCGRLGLESWPKEGLKICPTTYLLCMGGIYI
jgi:hypothetical protein